MSIRILIFALLAGLVTGCSNETSWMCPDGRESCGDVCCASDQFCGSGRLCTRENRPPGGLYCNPACPDGYTCTLDGCEPSSPSCASRGTPCTTDSECCDLCNTSTMRCAACGRAGDPCSNNDDCCAGNRCMSTPSGLECQSITTCGYVGDACSSGFDCCSNYCVSGRCSSTPPPPSCTGNGDTCSSGSECCSSYCVRGTCSSTPPSMCTDSGYACETNGECCNFGEGRGFCVEFDASTIVCADSCTSDSGCMSGCCVDLTRGERACGPSRFCGG